MKIKGITSKTLINWVLLINFYYINFIDYWDITISFIIIIIKGNVEAPLINLLNAFSGARQVNSFCDKNEIEHYSFYNSFPRPDRF